MSISVGSRMPQDGGGPDVLKAAVLDPAPAPESRRGEAGQAVGGLTLLAALADTQQSRLAGAAVDLHQRPASAFQSGI